MNNNAALKFMVQDFFGHILSFLLGIYQGVKLLGHMVIYVSPGRDCQTFFQSDCTIFYSL